MADDSDLGVVAVVHFARVADGLKRIELRRQDVGIDAALPREGLAIPTSWQNRPIGRLRILPFFSSDRDFLL